MSAVGGTGGAKMSTRDRHMSNQVCQEATSHSLSLPLSVLIPSVPAHHLSSPHLPPPRIPPPPK